MDRLNIAIIELDKVPENTNDYANADYGLARAFTKLGHNVFMVYPTIGIHDLNVEKLGDKFSVLKVPASSVDNRSFSDMFFIEHFQINVVQVNTEFTSIPYELVNYCKKNNVVIYNYLSNLSDGSVSDNVSGKGFMGKFFSGKDKKAFKKLTTVVTGDTIKAKLEEEGITNLKLIAEGLDIDIIPQVKAEKKEVRRRLGLPTDKTIVLYVGDLEADNRPFKLFNLADSLDDSFYYVVIGDGTLRELFLETAENKLTYTYLGGDVPREKMVLYYYLADYYVHFNEVERYDKNVLMAMYQRLITIGIKSSSVSNYVEDGNSGMYSLTPIKIGDRIKHEFYSDLLVKEMGDRARDRVIEKFTIEATAKKLLASVLN